MEASLFPILILFKIEVPNINGDWDTKDKFSYQDFLDIVFKGLPLISMLPSNGSTSFKIKLNNDDLPEPDGPAIIDTLPEENFKFRFF